MTSLSPKRTGLKETVLHDDPELNYHNLEGVHNGSEAMTVYPAMKDTEPSERVRMRQQLLGYCKLDTYTMVKLWQEIVRVCK